MAKTWTKAEWDDELWRIAEEAVKSRKDKKNFDGKSQMFIDAWENEQLKKAKGKLDKDFPYSLKDTEKDAVSNWKAEDAGNYLLGGGNAAFKNSYNPLVKKKMDDFAKLGPLVLGLADEGRDWYSMGQEDLFDAGKKLGYDTSSKKGKMDFLNDIADVQKAHDRGKMLEEFNRENTGAEAFLREVFYPSMMEEIRRQIVTGEGTQDQIDKAKWLDRGAAVLMGIAPDVGGLGALTKGTKAGRVMASPMAEGVLGAAAQGGLEAGRQAIKEKIDPELEADYGAALLASTLGATRPGMIGSFSALTQQIPHPSMARFSRGISAATRKGNPVEQERNMLEELLFNNVNRAKKYAANVEKIATTKRAIKNAENESQAIEGLFGKGDLVGLSPAEINKGNVEQLVNERMNALQLPGVYKSSEATASDAAKILKAYDDLSKTKFARIPGDVARPGEFDYLVTKGKTGDYLRQVDPEYWENIRRLFPMKSAEVEGMGPAYKAGLRTGQFLGDVGGRIEPVIKVNPFGPISGGRANIINNDYKETEWYKKLSKKQQEAFDDAYEKAKKANK